MRLLRLYFTVAGLLGATACSREMFCAPCPACPPPVVAAPAPPAAPTASAKKHVAESAAEPHAVKHEPAADPVEEALPGGRVRNAKEYFATLDKRFQPNASKDLHAVFQFDLTGPSACAYHADVDDGVMKLERGRADKADVTILASAEDYVKVVNGEMGGVGAVMGRKMKVSGSLSLARKMKQIFPPGRPDK